MHFHLLALNQQREHSKPIKSPWEWSHWSSFGCFTYRLVEQSEQ
jgi:hypothetical protein